MARRDDFLRSQKILRLATVGDGGVPHVVPVWYAYSSKKFLIGTSTKTQKAKNAGKNPRVGFCVDAGVNAPGIYGVAGSGRAELVLDGAKVRRAAKKILLKYFDSLESKSAAELLDMTDCIIEVTPERMASWSY